VPSPLFSRISLTLGIFGIAVGALARWQANIEGDLATLGIVAVIALGFSAALVGAWGVLQERPPADERAHMHQRAVDRAAWRACIPPVIAGATMLTFFALTDRWHDLSNPVQSQIALFAGLLGAIVGMLADRITRWDLVVIPAALIFALLAWGDRLPFDSPTTTNGQIVALLIVAVLIIGIAINVPQIVRGKRTRSTA